MHTNEPPEPPPPPFREGASFLDRDVHTPEFQEYLRVSGEEFRGRAQHDLHLRAGQVVALLPESTPAEGRSLDLDIERLTLSIAELVAFEQTVFKHLGEALINKLREPVLALEGASPLSTGDALQLLQALQKEQGQIRDKELLLDSAKELTSSWLADNLATRRFRQACGTLLMLTQPSQ